MISFREIERQFVIINNPKFVKLTGCQKEANSILCYGYVDNSAGLTYETVAATLLLDGDYSILDTIKCISLKIRANSVSKEEVIPIKNKALFKQYSYIVDNVNEFYYKDPEREECREVRELDQFRHAEFPDDVQVLFVKEGVRPEGIWVRTKKLIGREDGTVLLEGRMLNNPHADFGVTINDTVLFASGIVDEAETRVCIALLQNN